MRCALVTGSSGLIGSEVVEYLDQRSVLVHGVDNNMRREFFGAQGIPYRVFRHKGKQVRDNIHAFDVCTAIMAFAESPRPGAPYNVGGGRENLFSMVEAIARFELQLGRTLEWTYVDEPRRGDHVCDISDLSRFRGDYPEWQLTVGLDQLVNQLAAQPTLADSPT